MERQNAMTLVNIIGSGKMARGIAVRMLHGRQPVHFLGRNGEQTRALVESLGAGATGGSVGDAIDGSVVFLAVPHSETRSVVLEYGDGLNGKIIVDISNPVDYATFDKLTTAPGTSAAEETAALLQGQADVVKAFNTTFSATLEEGAVAGQPLDVFIAGDSETAKRQISSLVAAGGLRPIDVGPLRRSRELEAFMLLVMGLQVNPEHDRYNWNTAVKILP